MNKKSKDKKTKEAIAKMLGKEKYFQYLLNEIRANMAATEENEIDDIAKAVMDKMKHYE